MCGITAYCGNGFALPFLMQGLSKLEYRGYDSAGVTTLEKDGLKTVKCKGRLKNLEEKLQDFKMEGHVGIGHTRWATHGIPSNLNSHPHTNDDETISLVHNGIIENYRELKEELIQKGYHFQSETDSEVVVHLLDDYYDGDLFEAVKKVLKRIEGSYALCIVSTLEPNKVIVAKKDSPLIIGKADGAYVAASDIPALLEYTKDVYFLADYEMAILQENHIDFFTHEGEPIVKELVNVPYDLEAAKKDGYDTFMLKEIYEQPHVIAETLRGRIVNQKIVLDELNDIDFHQFNKVYFVACGTAYHASLCGSQVLERATKLPVIATVASEFRYNDPLVDEQTLAIFVSQSGETADTLAALRLAKEKGATTIAIANVLGSTISRDANYVLYTCAGPEIAVASTKAYTTQLVLLILLAYYIAQELGKEIDHELIQQLNTIPQYVENILKDHSIFENYAKMLENLHDAYFIGRSLDYASVLEGALKLKEVSYVHADAYVAGELKHGPIALIEDGSVVIAVATQPHIAAKTISNIQETMARGARVILLTTHGEEVKNVENTYYLPDVVPTLQAILVAIPLQLIAYYTACIKGCDVDKPRNLAKSVTVE
ncbi:MAG: glutamine--fructose-6-phosphate transaminase (isomerizing) [Longibaculum muris]|uniref:Glutamine--fructose-6-phosphate aminotransferase [isomerizing] n=1 Tax=Longibaculum muris TaxID=1796628 RepID=A0A4R3Z8A2_9FIRM|nr:glutamine--fructose-6-phosphate transaminase (isomerizing) [Longibaculum muris]KXU49001.1 glutamine-fructose-6-phosphate transaminase [Candidatus Stoquefichus sp. KLE1796]MBS5371298.1 glutamine--fructose-6-phosphate transaminase (isomerizing) [Coprobacillus cateniformis]MCR1886780.1 glutamine--fructose-6-phosphate transaminase (isomerizing) [Longibaculum muris]MED9810560.1 glutamine--fructose-6-phosphate transaminase (isomerizing) [Longibaculum muris]TCW02809.1 glucosamine--fructose-6-phosp